MKTQKTNNMLLRFYLMSILNNAFFYLPTLVYFFNTKMENPLYVSILISLKGISTFIFEVPTGYISDKYGRKVSIIISIVINIISLVMLIIGEKFILFAIAQVLFGMAETFRSGSDLALLYDNLKFENKTNQYEKSVQRNYLYISITLAVSYIIGAFIYQKNERLPFIISLILLILAFFISSTFKEYPYKSDSQDQLNIHQAILHLKSQSSMLWVIMIFVNIILGICISAYVYLSPLLLLSYGVEERYFGFIFSFGILASAISVKFTNKIKNKSLFLSIATPILIVTLCIICFLTNSSIGFVAFAILIRLIWGVFDVTYNIVVNDLIAESSIRATAMSIGNGVVGISSVINTTFFGIVLSYVNIRISMLFLVFMITFIAILFNYFLTGQNFFQMYLTKD